MAIPEDVLKQVNADNFAVLYRCRWSEDVAMATVPALVALLREPDPRIVADGLRALHRIGPAAFPAASAVCSVLSHPDALVRSLAVSTLGHVCLEHPADAIPRLLEVSERREVLEPALCALINFGSAAVCAAPLFCRTYQSRKAKLRRLAVRGLRACQANDADSLAVLEKAKSDANAEVRKAATRYGGLLNGRS